MTRLWSWFLVRMARDQRGQGTVEYVLVMLAVTAIALVLISWAKSGSGKSTLGKLFETVVGWVTSAARGVRF
ncbi:MAG: hypothetical protein KatS3mg011_0081 [Acidimicrobiia bacterium]|jgi:Flp pilus assembly pilin Flp|nr:MAG: hypothetical protein KatS3mg011_0081 [Acidimicrobiia bacterium]